LRNARRRGNRVAAHGARNPLREPRGSAFCHLLHKLIKRSSGAACGSTVTLMVKMLSSSIGSRMDVTNVFRARPQPARYITTAHSPLCRETMSLRGRGEDGSASGACEVPARHEPLGRSGHYEMPTEFQIEPRWRRISWS